jgi:hypothetical protein
MKNKPKTVAARDPHAKHPCEPYPPNTRRIHGQVIPSGVYRAALAPVLGDTLKSVPDPSAYAQAVIADMAPRDAAEEMLIAQLLFAHARVMRLTALANQQTGLESLRTVHEYADRASNTYRRLMLALAEYRRPPRTGDTFAVVKQANIASQQVIQNHENSNTNATNEQGCQPVRDPAPPALPTHAQGTSFLAFVSPASEALGTVHRPPDASRQSPFPAERDKAW